MEWIDVYKDKTRFELKEEGQVIAILQFADGVYVVKDCISKEDFALSNYRCKYAPNELDKEELFMRVEGRLLENWMYKTETIQKVISRMDVNKEIIISDYTFGQIVNVIEFDLAENKYVIFKARFKGIYKEDFYILNVFESYGGERDVFMLPRDIDKVYVQHDAAVRECVRLNESLREDIQ